MFAGIHCKELLRRIPCTLKRFRVKGFRAEARGGGAFSRNSSSFFVGYEVGMCLQL